MMDNDHRQDDAGPAADEQLARQLAELHEQIIKGASPARAIRNTVGDRAADVEENGKRRLASLAPLLAMISRVKSWPQQQARDLDAAPVSADAETRDAAADGPHETPVGESAGPQLASPLTVDPSKPLGPRSRIGPFRVRSQIGRGGFGLVFSAWDERLDRLVALKIPRPEALLSERLRDRFLREGRAAAALNHPNIVAVYEAGQDGLVCYLATELVNGEDLATWRRNAPAVDVRQAARWVAILADAMQHAHVRGVLHRDLKPANVLMADGVPRVTDFGLALRLGEVEPSPRHESIVGTPAFMAPEQAAGQSEAIDARADVYGLGAILYFLLTGQAPFSAATESDTLDAVRHRAPPPPRALNRDVPLDLQAICLTCLAKSPDQRYRSARDLMTDLERFLDGRPVSVRPLPSWQRLARWASRNKAVAIASSLAAVCLIGALGASVAGWAISAQAWHRERAAHQVADQRLAALQRKSSDLTTAIDRLFIGLAMSPEVQRESADSLRRILLEEANAFYHAFLLDEPDDERLQVEYARTLHHLGQINETLGDFAQGVDLVRRALDVVIRDDGALIDPAELGEWHVTLGRGLTKQAHFGDAREAFQRALDYVEWDPDVSHPPEIMVRRATILAHLADTLLLGGNIDEAVQSAQESEALWNLLGAVGQDHPALHDHGGNLDFERALAIFVQGEALQMTGDFPEAVAAHERALAFFEVAWQRSAQAPGVALYRARCWRGLGIAYALQGEFENARVSYGQALSILDDLVAQHPLVEPFARLLCSVRYSLAATAMSVHEYGEVEEIIQTNVADLQSIGERFPESLATTFSSLGDHYNLLSAAYREWDQRTEDDALLALDIARDWFERSILERPDWTRPQMALARAESNLGLAHLRRGETVPALNWVSSAYQRNVELLADQPQWAEALHSQGFVLSVLASARARAGEWELARQAVDELLALVPDHPEAPSALLKCSLILTRLGHFNEAAEALEAYAQAHLLPDEHSIDSALAASRLAQWAEGEMAVDWQRSYYDLIAEILQAPWPDGDALRDRLRERIEADPALQSLADGTLL